MVNFKGVIIEESLKDKSVIKQINVLSTKIEKVTEEHKTPWLKQWTLHTVEIPENKVKQISEILSKNLEKNWYADFRDNSHHYIIFPNKIFFIDRTSQKQYDEAKNYGLLLGLPPHQVNFHTEID